MAVIDEKRRRMVAQIAARGVTDERVLAALGSVRRERFVPGHLAARAYDDGPLDIGSGQTISQPYIVAVMAEAAGIEPGDRVLEVGTGSGYGAAVLAAVARGRRGVLPPAIDPRARFNGRCRSAPNVGR